MGREDGSVRHFGLVIPRQFTITSAGKKKLRPSCRLPEENLVFKYKLGNLARLLMLL